MSWHIPITLPVVFYVAANHPPLKGKAAIRN